MNRWGDCGCIATPRAAGMTYAQVRGLVCGQPGMPEVLDATHALIDLVPIREAAELAARIANKLGLPVDARDLDAVWDALDGLLELCDSRAGGLQGDTLRGTASALETVDALAVPLHAAAVAIGASGFLVEVVGVTVTAAIGAVISAVVGICQVAVLAGLPAKMRQAAADADSAETPGQIPAPSFPSLTGGKGSFQPGTLTPFKPLPKPTTSSDEGGTVAAILGGLAFLGLAAKVLL